jgi:hypothetical protein
MGSSASPAVERKLKDELDQTDTFDEEQMKLLREFESEFPLPPKNSDTTKDEMKANESRLSLEELITKIKQHEKEYGVGSEAESMDRHWPGFKDEQPKSSEDGGSTKSSLKKFTPLKQSSISDIKGDDPQQGVEEDIDNVHYHTLQDMTDAVALGTARGLAAVKDKPTQAPVSGYLGNRNLNNGDVLNSSATGTAVPDQERKGDAFVSAKESHNSSTDTLRPLFGVAPANGVIPSVREQIQSDVLFNDFSIVAPGHGLGVTNKMFLMEEMRDKKIVYREPLAEPRKYDGPTDGVVPPPLKWQNEITRHDRGILAAQAIAEASAGVLLEARAGAGSLNVLGDDFGMFQRVSDKGLKRYAESPLEPAIRLPKAWERVRPLPGVQWARKQTRRLFDALRYPERLEVNMAQDGGPTMGKRNALAVYPFPVTSH